MPTPSPPKGARGEEGRGFEFLRNLSVMHTAAPVPDPRPTGRPHFPSFRQFLQAVILLVVFLLVFRTVGAEPFHVPTGSMWPALAGNHRATDCPRCGYRVLVGRHRAEAGSEHENQHYYRLAVC